MRDAANNACAIRLWPLCGRNTAGFFPAGRKGAVPDLGGHGRGQDHAVRCDFLCALWRAERRQPRTFHAALPLCRAGNAHFRGIDLSLPRPGLYGAPQSGIPPPVPARRRNRAARGGGFDLSGRQRGHAHPGSDGPRARYSGRGPRTVRAGGHDRAGRFFEAATRAYGAAHGHFPPDFQYGPLSGAASRAEGSGGGGRPRVRRAARRNAACPGGRLLRTGRAGRRAPFPGAGRPWRWTWRWTWRQRKKRRRSWAN